MERIEERKRSYFNLYSHKYSFSFFFFFLRIIFYLVVCLQLKLWGFKINILARELQKYGTLHEFACHPCAGAMLIFSVSFQF